MMHPEDDDGLSSDAHALLRSVRDADGPTAADRARVRRALGTALVASTAAVSTTVASSAAASSVATGSLAIGTKLTIAALLVTGLGATVVLTATSVRGPDEPPQQREAVAEAPLVARSPSSTADQTSDQTVDQTSDQTVDQTQDPTISAIAPEVLPAPAEARVSPAARRAPPVLERVPPPVGDQSAPLPVAGGGYAPPPPAEVNSAGPPSPSAPLRGAPEASLPTASTLPLELPMMTQARTAIARGDHAVALAALREHEARFPNGVLAIERDAARALASCQSGAPEGASLGATFLASHGAHPMADRVATACGITR